LIPRVTQAAIVRDYVIHLRFADGTEGDISFEKDLEGEVFEPLRNAAYFQRFRLHPELHTLVWPNGADFAPEFLYSKLQVSAR
jgi:hypothetical protein